MDSTVLVALDKNELISMVLALNILKSTSRTYDDEKAKVLMDKLRDAIRDIERSESEL